MGSSPIPYLPTAEVFTGNPATVNDAFDATKLNNGARVALGTAVYSVDAAGNVTKWRYVRLNTTVDATKVYGPVYWKDNTYKVVTQKSSEALMGLNGVAGILVNLNAVNGNYVFICVYGHLAAMPIAASTAVGDSIIGAAGTQLTARVAANTAATNTLIALAETAVSGGLSDVRIMVEDIGG